MITAFFVGRLFLAGVFAIAGITKITDQPGSRKALVDFGIPILLARPLSVLLPVLELSCAIALLPASSALWGSVGALAMLLLFTVAIVINLALGRSPNCHCFGQLHNEPIGRKTVARNLALAAVAGFVSWLQMKQPGLNIVDLLRNNSRLELASLVFAALAVFQTWLSFHLLRQNGRLLLRVEALEARQGPAPSPKPRGLPVNTSAPGFSLRALDGGILTLADVMEAGRSTVLTFIEPGCTHCDALLPELAQWQEEHHERLSIVVISRGRADANRGKVAGLRLRNVLLQKQRETASRYEVTVTPSAVLLDNGKIASDVAEGPEAIRSLVGRAILPPPVKKGDLTPSLVLADITGNRVDLGTLQGRRSLLLFWNPSCGFCQQMIPDLKTWEGNQPPSAPELLVISSGSFEDSRAQGFRSTVLLDPHWAAGHVFGAGGTPSAVVLNEDGRVASEVAVGADAIWALVGATRTAAARG